MCRRSFLARLCAPLVAVVGVRPPRRVTYYIAGQKVESSNGIVIDFRGGDEPVVRARDPEWVRLIDEVLRDR